MPVNQNKLGIESLPSMHSYGQITPIFLDSIKKAQKHQYNQYTDNNYQNMHKTFIFLHLV